MTSNIRVQRHCQLCGQDFIARTTYTRYCSDTCAKRAHKVQITNNKIKRSNEETLKVKTKPILEIQAKQFLTVKEAAILLKTNAKSIYRAIENGTIPALNLSQRLTRIKRTDIDHLFKEL
ncbi:MAG: helix-turn-helix domain-containing protein [Saprospiraceae bacterium]|nr:helix-turn-helix domain-containing protein [Saprospiraceae bacterium]HRG68512.1 helix-turn-helix domain-containing protein [Saprospiraceae bacterium]